MFIDPSPNFLFSQFSPIMCLHVLSLNSYQLENSSAYLHVLLLLSFPYQETSIFVMLWSILIKVLWFLTQTSLFYKSTTREEFIKIDIANIVIACVAFRCVHVRHTNWNKLLGINKWLLAKFSTGHIYTNIHLVPLIHRFINQIHLFQPFVLKEKDTIMEHVLHVQ